MAKNNGKNLTPGWSVVIIFMGLVDLGLLLRRLMMGHNVALFNPQGYIAKQQHSLILFIVALLLTIIIPTMFLLYFTAWKYRESNTKATYEPSKKNGKKLNIGMWALPGSIILLLALVMWPTTHKLQPQKAIAANVKPITIQVVSLRWKWLFIYPEQNIASVNFVQIPVDTPVEFKLTADDAPMSSFWVPNLGGQLYSMTGMVNTLNLIADKAGDYPGSSAELNGAGFAGMKFTTRATSSEDFDQWVEQVKETGGNLNEAKYADLVKPSENNVSELYGTTDTSLYDKVLMKYTGPAGGHSNHE